MAASSADRVDQQPSRDREVRSSASQRCASSGSGTARPRPGPPRTLTGQQAAAGASGTERAGSGRRPGRAAGRLARSPPRLMPSTTPASGGRVAAGSLIPPSGRRRRLAASATSVARVGRMRTDRPRWAMNSTGCSRARSRGPRRSPRGGCQSSGRAERTPEASAGPAPPIRAGDSRQLSSGSATGSGRPDVGGATSASASRGRRERDQHDPAQRDDRRAGVSYSARMRFSARARRPRRCCVEPPPAPSRRGRRHAQRADAVAGPPVGLDRHHARHRTGLLDALGRRRARPGSPIRKRTSAAALGTALEPARPRPRARAASTLGGRRRARPRRARRRGRRPGARPPRSRAARPARARSACRSARSRCRERRPPRAPDHGATSAPARGG